MYKSHNGVAAVLSLFWLPARSQAALLFRTHCVWLPLQQEHCPLSNTVLRAALLALGFWTCPNCHRLPVLSSQLWNALYCRMWQSNWKSLRFALLDLHPITLLFSALPILGWHSSVTRAAAVPPSMQCA